jgi:spermidine/putrescine transport system permease protein
MNAKPVRRFSFSRLVFILSMVFLFTPLLVLVLFSFNANKAPIWTGFSLNWYVRLFTHSDNLWRAFFNSVTIALSAAVFSTVIGTLGAIGVKWYEFKIKKYVQAITFLPLVVPEIIVGMSLLAFFAGVKFNVGTLNVVLGMNLGLGWLTIFFAHTTFCLPFVYLMVLGRLDEFDYSIIEAAHDLGASEGQTMTKVIIPVTMPGIISGFLTALTLSLEDFVITYFVSGVDSTLPVVIYNQMYKGGVSPVVNALSAIMILGTVILALLARNFLKYIASNG